MNRTLELGAGALLWAAPLSAAFLSSPASKSSFSSRHQQQQYNNQRSMASIMLPRGMTKSTEEDLTAVNGSTGKMEMEEEPTMNDDENIAVSVSADEEDTEEDSDNEDDIIATETAEIDPQVAIDEEHMTKAVNLALSK